MSSNSKGPGKSSKTTGKDPQWNSFLTTWAVIGALSLVWWLFESQLEVERFILAAGLCVASFMVGSLIGFLFSSHGEEADTIGKVRDWVIGGVTTLTIAKAASIKATIETFEAAKGPDEYAIAFGGAVAYAALGFLFMYFMRELYFNPRLATSRRERGIIEGTRQVEQVVKSFQIHLPAEILTGGSSVDDITNDASKQAANEMKDKLFSDEVKAFLDGVNQSLDGGGSLDWDVVSKVAYIQYYRTYFTGNEGKEEEKITQARCALDWIQRALLLNPHNADMTTKYADMLAVTKDFAGAVSVLERLLRQPDSPLVVRQWLGYYTLFLPKRLADSVRYSEEFRQLVGENTDSLFNIACAYAQAFCEGPGAEPGLDDAKANHDKALDYLRQALLREPGYATIVLTKWTRKDESFVCFANDPAFMALVAPKAAAPAA